MLIPFTRMMRCCPHAGFSMRATVAEANLGGEFASSHLWGGVDG